MALDLYAVNPSDPTSARELGVLTTEARRLVIAEGLVTLGPDGFPSEGGFEGLNAGRVADVLGLDLRPQETVVCFY